MRLDHGQIELVLGDETLELKVTPRAIWKINNRFGDWRGAMEQVQRFNFAAIVFVVETACERQELSERVLATGLLNVTPTVCEYLMLLLNPSGREAAGEGKA